MSKNTNRVLLLRSTDFDKEPRVDRAINDLEGAGYEVKKIYWQRTPKDTQVNSESMFHECFQFPAPYGAGLRNILGQTNWQIWLSYKILLSSSRFIYACDADTAAVAAFWKKLKKYKLIYDQFDHISSRLDLKFIQNISHGVEKYIARRADLVVVASSDRTIQSKFQSVVVSNNPVLPPRDLRTAHNSMLTISYCGVLQEDRGLRELIKVIENSKQIILRIGGFGPLEHFIKEKASDNIIFLGKLDPEKVIDEFWGSDISYAMYDPGKINNQNSASSRLFETTIAGTPCIVSKGTNLEKLVADYQLGWAIEYGNMEELNRLFVHFRSQGALKPNYEENRSRFLRDFDAQKQHQELLNRLINLREEVSK